jgi:hypothetical protein
MLRNLVLLIGALWRQWEQVLRKAIRPLLAAARNSGQPPRNRRRPVNRYEAIRVAMQGVSDETQNSRVNINQDFSGFDLKRLTAPCGKGERGNVWLQASKRPLLL